MAQLIIEGMANYKLSYRAIVVQSLADLRREWQKAATGDSLVDVQASVGLLLSDIADRLELNTQERHVMLGGMLINQVNASLEERVSSKL